MFVGHFAAGIAAKALEPRVPLWALLGASQLIDFGWAGLVIAGVEKLRIDPSLPGSVLDLHYMPFTHSLPAVLVWALAAGFLARTVLPARAALVVALVVLSHWLLDFIVHRPDLPLGLLAPKVGLGLWNWPVPEMALEIGLLGLATGLLTARSQRAWPALALLAALTGLQMMAALLPPPAGSAEVATSALLAFLVVMALGWGAERLSGGAGRQR